MHLHQASTKSTPKANHRRTCKVHRRCTKGTQMYTKRIREVHQTYGKGTTTVHQRHTKSILKVRNDTSKVHQRYTKGTPKGTTKAYQRHTKGKSQAFRQYIKGRSGTPVMNVHGGNQTYTKGPKSAPKACQRYTKGKPTLAHTIKGKSEAQYSKITRTVHERCTSKER